MSMKEPGQIAYEAMFAGPNECAFSWRDTAPEVRSRYARVEAAILAAKPERVGVWVTDINTGGRRFIIVDRAVERVTCPSNKELMARHWVCFEGGSSVAVSAADARKVVEALGGEWMEGAQ